MQPARLGVAAAVFLLPCALLWTLVLAPSSRAQTVETSQQVNERLRSLAASTHAPPPSDYVIGSGDLVSVIVFDVPELSRDLRVSQTGTIGVPLIPVRLHVAGLTEVQAERKIEEVLEANGLVSHAEVSVVVREKKSKPITVVGAVGHSMVYSADRQVTLIEVLAEAGGIAADAGDSVIITRPEIDATAAPTSSDPNAPPEIGPADAAPIDRPVTQLAIPGPTPPASPPSANSSSEPPTQNTPVFPSAVPVGPPATEDKASASSAAPQVVSSGLANTITINLNQILETGNLSNNIVLLPGDVVTVPHAGIIYVLGGVARPGGYTVTNDRAQLTTLKVLSLAGGLNRTAKATHAVIVRKDGTGQQREIEVDLKKITKFQTEDVQLRPSDILYVPTSGAKLAGYTVGALTLGVATGALVYRLIP
jgi:protein involved in polysaccharide export with SLBB domain